MTPVPFFLVPLALGSGFVLGWLLSWMRGGDARRRLRDARIVFLNFSRKGNADLHTVVNFERDLHRALSGYTALSGKERK